MDIEKARFNMIEQQVRPWDVLDQDILDSLALVKREDFVPPAYRGLAFADVEIPLAPGGIGKGQVMFTPKVEARILQALAVKRHESALEIGTGSGFGTALLAHRTRKVQSWEIDPTLHAFAAANLRRAGILDVRLHEGDGSRLATDERFDVIILSGSVAEVPPDWLERLNEGGRLAAIVGDAPSMRARIHTRMAGDWTTIDLFETVAARLHGFPDGRRFRF
ncbi:MAG: protein-L-isoaspartate O-methyltransferase [Burkholderiaceae bacterium]|nr:protein-L-isoaspartate O-methyltransferase [Burkholderiaceae bacterium]